MRRHILKWDYEYVAIATIHNCIRNNLHVHVFYSYLFGSHFM